MGCLEINSNLKNRGFLIKNKITTLDLLVEKMREGLIEFSQDSVERWVYDVDENGNFTIDENGNKVLSSGFKTGVCALMKRDLNCQKLSNEEIALRIIQLFILDSGSILDKEETVTSGVDPTPDKTIDNTVDDTDNEETGYIPKSVELKDSSNLIFGRYDILENYRLKDFETEMLLRMSYYQLKRGSLYLDVKDNKLLNRSIVKYKKVLFNRISKFLKDSNYLTEELKTKIPTTMYDKDGRLKLDNLKLLLNTFESLFKNGIINPEDISYGWEEEIGTTSLFMSEEDSLTEDVTLWEAASSFLNLKHFDESLKQAKMNKLISILGNENSEVSENNIQGDVLVKYSMGKDTSHLIKNWNIGEYRNAISENSRIADLVVNSIQKYDFDPSGVNGKKIIGRVTVSEIASSWGRFVQACRALSQQRTNQAYLDLYEDVLKIPEDPSFRIKKILDTTFSKSQGNADLRRALMAAGSVGIGFSPQDLNILYSIYMSEIKSSSLRQISQSNSLRDSTSTLGEYLKSDVIYSIIRKNNSVNYQVTVYENGEYVTKNLAKSTVVLRSKLNYLKGANSEMAMKLPHNIREQLKSFEISRIKVGGKYLTNAILIELGGRKCRLVLTKGASLGASKATNAFKIIPELDDDITQLLLNNLDVTYHGLIMSDPYNDAILEAVNNSDKFTKEQKEALLNREYGLLLNKYDKILRNLPLSQKSIDEILNGERKEIGEILDFIDAMLPGLNIKSESGLKTLRYFINSRYNVSGNLENYGNNLRIILSEAAIHAYKLSLLGDVPADSSVKDYVLSQDSYVADAARTERIFTLKNGQYQFNALTSSDWLDNWFLAKAMTDGNATRSTTKGRDGNDKANYVPGSLSDHVFEIYSEHVEYAKTHPDSPLSRNLVLRNSNLISDISRDASTESRFGDRKQVKELHPSELIYHAIVNNFFGNFINNGTFSILPTVYSDKTAFIQFIINASQTLDGTKDKTLWDLNERLYDELFKESTKIYWENQYKNSLTKFRKLLGLGDLATAYEINTMLKSMSSGDLEERIRLYNENKPDSEQLTFYKDSDYRIQGKYISLNETSINYATMHDMDARIKKEKFNFISLLIKNNVNFFYDKRSPIYRLLHTSDKAQAITTNTEIFEKEWVSYGNLVLAKVKTNEVDEKGNPIYRNIYNEHDLNAAGENIIMNPVLLKFFYIDNICSVNIKNALVGNEISDPLKAGLNMKLDFSPTESKYSDNTNKDPNDVRELLKLNTSDIEKLQTIDLAELGLILNGEDTSDFALRVKDNKYVKKIYDKLIYRCIATSEGSQYKRNVIVPASGNYLKLNSLTGIGLSTKVAFMEDPQSQVYNPSGHMSEEDAEDGSAEQISLQAILENGSLNADSVGYRYKKPIWYYYDEESGCSGLMKFAVHTIHNDAMRNSLKSASNMNKLWRKMTDIKWDKDYDLCNSVAWRINHKLNFANDIVSFCKNDAGERTGLYYEESGSVYRIADFRRDVETGIYYTVEYKQVYVNGKYSEESPIYVAHVFDAQGNDLRISRNIPKILNRDKQPVENKSEISNFITNVVGSQYNIQHNYHNISSLYELHLTMGGIMSVERKGNQFVPSESSNYATVAFMNNVAEVRDEYKGKDDIPQSQKGYRLPLKEFFIGYKALETSNKRHTGNINSVDALTNDSPLIYTSLDNKGLCEQQDPSHTADEAELTEMSLVIASLDVGGRLHHVAKEVFTSLGNLIIDKLNLKEKILTDLNNSNATEEERQQYVEKLYDIIVREFIYNYEARSATDFANSIVKTIRDNFGAEKLFQDESFKLPMSDPNIFRQLVTTFVADVNKALKRKYSGIGDVMTPGFNKMQMFHLIESDGTESEMMFDDVYTKSLLQYKHHLLTNYNIKNIIDRAISTAYLKNWDGGRDRVNSSEAWFFTTDTTFAFDSLAVGDDRYKGSRGFEIVKHNDESDVYEVHFKGSLEKPFTELEKVTYLLAIREFLKRKGAKKLVLTGDVSKGGFSGFNRFINLGFKTTGKMRPVRLKDDDARQSILDRWSMLQSPSDYISTIEDENKKEQELAYWKNTTFRDTDLNQDILVPELELTDEIINVQDVLLKSIGKSTIERRQNIASWYLNDIQEATDENGEKLYYRSVTNYEPCDLVEVKGVDGNWYNFDLDDIDEYYNFKERLHFERDSVIEKIYQELMLVNGLTDISQITTDMIINQAEWLAEKLGYKNKKWILSVLNSNLNTETRLNIRSPRNLRPQRYRFKTSDGNTYSMYDMDEIRKLHKARGGKKNKNAQIDPNVDKAIYRLINENKVSIGGLLLDVIPETIENRAAEALMTNIHDSTFKLDGTSLYQQIQGFKARFIDKEDNINYDLVLKGKGSIGIAIDNDNIQGEYDEINAIEISRYVGDIKVIFATNSDGEELYAKGFYKEVKSYVARKNVENGKFYFYNAKGEVVNDENLVVMNNKVYRKTYFVREYKGYSVGDLAKSYRMMNINSRAILDYKELSGQDFTIASLIKDISESKNSTHILLTNTINNRNKVGIYKTIMDGLKKSGESYKFWNNILKINSLFLDLCYGSFRDISINTLTVNKKNYQRTLLAEAESLKNMIKNSFLLSLYFTAARIPAQSLQSFMKMKCVGFLLGTDNLVIVSHWQTWLQGSDYDIDKAYMMNYEFDGNGKFIGWSNLFDYSSFDSLEASLQLPSAKGVEVSYNSKVFDIDLTEDFEKLYQVKDNNVLKITLLAKIITKIENLNNGNVRIATPSSLDPEFQQYVLEQLLIHENTVIPENRKEAASKNLVSSSIQRIVNDPLNMQLAYSPISMKVLLDIAKDSPKGNLVLGLTSFNPLTKYIMQCLNMIGKNVISVAAVGEKIFMGLSFYFNEISRTKNSMKERRLKFENTTTRIMDRSKGEPRKFSKTSIADVNWEDPETRNRIILIHKLMKNSPRETIIGEDGALRLETDGEYNERIGVNTNHTDLLISQLLSAATDNAKELILDKINSGKDTANIYLHLLILGYSMNDIASFMISPAVSVMSDVLNSNMFDNYQDGNLRVDEALNIAKNGYNMADFVDKVATLRVPEDVLNSFEERLDSFRVLNKIRGDIQEAFGLVNEKGNPLTGRNLDTAFYYYINNEDIDGVPKYIRIRLKIEEILQDPLYSNYAKNMIMSYYNSVERLALSRENYLAKAKLDSTTAKTATISDFKKDLEEFSKISKAAKETSVLGTLFGLNKEVKPELSQIISKLNGIESKVDRQVKPLKTYLTTTDLRLKDKIMSDILNTVGDKYTYEEIVQIIEDAEDIILKGFNFERFASRHLDTNYNNTGKTYREVAIDLYDIMKSHFNILDVINEHPQYRSAMETWIVAYQLLKTSAKSSLADAIRVDLKEHNVAITELQVNGIFNYAEELLITKWLKQSNVSFPLLNGTLYFDKNYKMTEVRGESEPRHLIRTASDAASFKLWFELYFIPLLKTGSVDLGDEIINIDKNNEFINLLIYGEEHGHPVYRLNILMDLIDKNTETAKKFNKIVKDLNLLPKKLLNYIYLYNIMVSHNAPGNDRFANIFSALFDINDTDSYLVSYEKFLGQIDMDIKNIKLEDQRSFLTKELGYDTEDAEFKIAPKYFDGRIPKDNRARIVALSLYDGTITYKKLVESNDGNKTRTWLDYTAFDFYDKNSDELLTRLFNYTNYGILYSPKSYERDTISTIFSNKLLKEFTLLLRQLVYELKLVISRDC